MWFKLAIVAAVLIGTSTGLTVSVKQKCPVCIRAPCPCNPIPPIGPCPFGLPQVACKVDPCTVTQCKGFPDAKCVPNYCGGCKAEFFDKLGNKLTCGTGCPNEVQCFADPCQVNKCEAFPDAKCVSNFCGGCFADFFVNGKKVDCTKKEEPCQCNNIVSPCDPITKPVCPRFPTATCEPKCCDRVWKVNGRVVNCNLPDTPGRCLKEGAECTKRDSITPWLPLSRKLIPQRGCCSGTECCACGPPVVRDNTPPPTKGFCRKRCICPIG